jgi:hypothetical protein
MNPFAFSQKSFPNSFLLVSFQQQKRCSDSKSKINCRHRDLVLLLLFLLLLDGVRSNFDRLFFFVFINRLDRFFCQILCLKVLQKTTTKNKPTPLFFFALTLIACSASPCCLIQALTRSAASLQVLKKKSSKKNKARKLKSYSFTVLNEKVLQGSKIHLSGFKRL